MDFAPDIQVDWVRMAQNVLSYIDVIVWRFFNKGSLVSEGWKNEHQDDFEEERESPPERMLTAEERRGQLNLEPSLDGVVRAAIRDATSS